MDIHTWIAFTVAYALMALAPGPVILLVVSYALAYGRRTALAVVAGTALGDASCLMAAMFGVAAVLAASEQAFLILKLAGAAYLVFLGLRLWRSPAATPETAQPRRSLPRTFLHAYLTTVFNPKSVLFFMVFVPQFMDTHAPLAPQLAMMLASVVLCGVLIDGNYSLFATRLRSFIRTPHMQRAVNRTSGGLLVGEGVLAAIWRAL